MHSTIAQAIAIAPQAARAACPSASEKVGVRHIRLVLPHHCLSARVGSFFAADQVLLSWAMRSQGALECEFEIVYDDGRTLAGQYRFQRKAATRPALMAFIRKTIRSLCEGRLKGPLLRGLVDGPHSFLAHYETKDFTTAA